MAARISAAEQSVWADHTVPATPEAVQAVKQHSSNDLDEKGEWTNKWLSVGQCLRQAL